MTAASRAIVVLLLLGLAGPAAAQEMTINFGDQASLATRAVEIIALVTVLSLAPAIAIMVTCFPFIVTVLAILRQGLGLQQSPPNMLIVSLALFLTWFVMQPVFDAAWMNGLQPLSEGKMALQPALQAAIEPFRHFMEGRTAPGTIAALADLRAAPPAPDGGPALSLLVPAFMLSEMARAFQVGFLIFLPFLIIDLVVSAVLMSMGMMMVPPAVVSLPFKLAFFVAANGWTLVSTALVRSYF